MIGSIHIHKRGLVLGGGLTTSTQFGETWPGTFLY